MLFYCLLCPFTPFYALILYALLYHFTPFYALSCLTPFYALPCPFMNFYTILRPGMLWFSIPTKALLIKERLILPSTEHAVETHPRLPGTSFHAVSMSGGTSLRWSSFEFPIYSVSRHERSSCIQKSSCTQKTLRSEHITTGELEIYRFASTKPSNNPVISYLCLIIIL